MNTLPPDPVVTTNLIRALAAHVIDEVGAALEEATSLSPSASSALLNIGSRPTRSVADLASWLRLSHSATVRVVDQLDRKGWIRRRRASSDGRQTELVLTARGARAFERGVAACDGIVEDLLSPLGTAERASLDAALRKLMSPVVRDRTHARVLCRFCDHSGCRGPSCPVGTAVR